MTTSSKPLLSSLNTTEELQQQRPPTAILPVGATEQHSVHLPLGTDWIIVEAMAHRVAKELGAYCLPVLPFSISHMHRGQLGTVWLRNETLARVVHDIATSLRQEGFKHLVLLNGHGGNFILHSLVQDLNLEYPDFLTLAFTPSDLIPASGVFKHKSTWRHADEYETSAMLALRPELVRTDKLRDQQTEPDRDLLRFVPFKEFSPMTHTGYPTEATAEQGQRAMDFILTGTVEALKKTIEKVTLHREKKS